MVLPDDRAILSRKVSGSSSSIGGRCHEQEESLVPSYVAASSVPSRQRNRGRAGPNWWNAGGQAEFRGQPRDRCLSIVEFDQRHDNPDSSVTGLPCSQFIISYDESRYSHIPKRVFQSPTGRHAATLSGCCGHYPAELSEEDQSTVTRALRRHDS